MSKLNQYIQAGAIFAESLGDSIPEMERKGWTVNSLPERARGRIGLNTRFDGSNDAIKIKNPLNGLPMSFSFWIKTNLDDWDNDFVGILDNANLSVGTNDGFYIFGDDRNPTVGRLAVNLDRNSVNAFRFYDNFFDSSNKWNHVIIIYSDIDTINVYKNGILLSPSSTTTGSGDHITNNFKITIAGRDDLSNAFLPGYISNLLIFDRDLSAQEVDQIYRDQVFNYMDSCISYWKLDDPNPRDLIGINDGIGTSLSSSNIVDGPYGGKAIDFDGSADYISLGNLQNKINTNNFTVVSVFKTIGSGVNSVILGNRPTGGGGSVNGFIFGINSSNQIRFQMDNNDGGFVLGNGSSIVNNGKWTMGSVSITRNSSTGGVLYINGDTNGSTFNPVAVENTLVSNNYAIGRQSASDSTGYLNGQISRVMLFNKALTQLQIKHLYEQIKRGRL